MIDNLHKVQQSTKVILNSNVNTANIVSLMNWIDLSELTLKYIIEAVEPLCGVQAVNAMVIYGNSIKKYNVYSNDGIHVTKSIEFASPIQEHIADNIIYVGERVEKASSDGTSTAIICTAKILLKIQQEIKKDVLKICNKYKGNNIQITKEIQICLNSYCDSLISILKKLKKLFKLIKIDLNKFPIDIYRKIIHDLAFITSKGNEKFSSIVAEIYKEKDIPIDKFSHYLYMREPIETEEVFRIKYPNEDVLINVFVNNNITYNYRLNTAVKYDNADVILIPDHVSADRIEFIKQLKLYLNDCKNPVVVVSLGFDPSTLAVIMETFKHLPLIYCQYVNYNENFRQNPIELNSILYRAGLPSLNIGNDETNIDNITLKNVKIIIDENKLSITDINGSYFNTKSNDSIVSEAYVSDDVKYNKYHELLNDIEKTIDTLKNAHDFSKDKSKDLKEFARIYKNMICNKMPILMIGGKTNDHLSNINMTEDVLGTIDSAINHGIVFDGILKLLYFIKMLKLSEDKSISTQNIPNKVNDIFYKTFIDFYNLNHKSNIDNKYFNEKISLDCLYFLGVLFTEDEKDFVLNEEIFKYGFIPYNSDHLFKPKYIDVEDTLNRFWKNESIPIIQSYKTYDELIDRMIEVLPKLIKTICAIVPGSVFKE